jgi:type II secretion system protein G
VVVNLLPAKDQADIDLMRTQIDQFDNALSMFKLHMGRYPTDDEGLPALWNKDVLEDEEEAVNWKGPYLENPSPRDRWGSEWVYRAEGEIRGEAFYDIVSLGPDKEEGTDDDITNHDRFKDAEGEISEDFSEFTPSGGDAATGGARSGGGGGGGG